MEERSLESGRDEALIRVMLTLGRRGEVSQALIPGRSVDLNDGALFL